MSIELLQNMLGAAAAMANIILTDLDLSLYSLIWDFFGILRSLQI